MIRIRTILAAAVLALATPAGAADIFRGGLKDGPADTVQVETSSNPFAGLYVGVFGAWEKMDVEHGGSVEVTDDCQNCGIRRFIGDGVAGDLPGIDDDAFAFGVNAGYNFTAGRVYFGPRVSFSYGETEATLSAGEVGLPGSISGDLTVSKDWLAEIDGKIGVALTDRIGVYVVGGLAFMDLEARVRGGLTGGPDLVDISHSETLTGWSAGVGADVVLFGNVKAFVEYKHFDFDTLSGSGTALEDCVAYTYGADTKFDTIKVGFNMNF
jgi:outer membrane immunogenic protein